MWTTKSLLPVKILGLYFIEKNALQIDEQIKTELFCSKLKFLDVEHLYSWSLSYIQLSDSWSMGLAFFPVKRLKGNFTIFIEDHGESLMTLSFDSGSYRVFIKYCVFPYNVAIFLNSASSAAVLVFNLPLCTHTDTDGKPREAIVWNIF